MLSRIRHRGPDGANILEFARMVIGQRLHSALDRTRGNSPAVSQDGKRVLAFNGRIYNCDALRRHLDQIWETDGDTETLMRLFEKKGVECLKDLDGLFAFVLRDGDDFFVARDPVGVKPLYYATRDEGRIFASELKAFGKMCTDFREFPPGCYFHSRLGTGRFYRLPSPGPGDMTITQAALRIRLTMECAVGKPADDDGVVGVFLSGGLDSSILAWLLKHSQRNVPSFSVGLSGSRDEGAAEDAAEALGTDHVHRPLRADEVVESLPQVIYLLESFDARVVRAAVCNYFLAELAATHVSSVLCGDGADELFGGYESLRELPPAERSATLWRLTSGLHNTELQRMDRMTMAHGMEARVPFLDKQVIGLAFSIPDWMKTGANGETKWILRHAFADALPNWILRRKRVPFAAGAGIETILKLHAEKEVSDSEFAKERAIPWAEPLQSKEEVLYYRLWRKHFVPPMARLVGRTMVS
jgi:asparagine synthase (glutamine-hydrolysing)